MIHQSSAPRPILIIDDNPDIHQDFLKILSPNRNAYAAIDHLASDYFDMTPPGPESVPAPPYRLSFALQGQDGLSMIRKAREDGSPFMLAFVDMRMPPGMDGLATIRYILRDDPFVQVVLCTAYADYSFQDITRELGPTPNVLILKKPFDTCEVEQLASALTEKWLVTRASLIKEEELNALVTERTRSLSLTNEALALEINERRRAENSIRILTRENLRIQEKERQRIACDLHDSVAQDLAALLIRQEILLDNLAAEKTGDAEADVRQSIRILRSTIDNVRSISYNLRPPSLNEFGIVHAMGLLCDTFFNDGSVHVSFYTSGMKNRRFDDTTEINLYRIFQEAMNNVRNHARPANVVVSLVATPDHITLSIKDDGVGFDVDERLPNAVLDRRMGLKGIEERVHLIGGRLDIHSVPGTGTEIVIRIDISVQLTAAKVLDR
ncbi:hypothetical protein JCM14469_28520 [Desulfatiferula olefinivorans]